VHEAIEPDKTAAGHHDKRDGDIRDVVGQHVGRVRHLEAALPAIVDRDAVVADAEYRNDLERGQRVEECRRCHRAATLHQTANLRRSGGEQRGLVRRLNVIVAAIVGLERIVEKRRKRCGDDDVGKHGFDSLGGLGGGPF